MLRAITRRLSQLGRFLWSGWVGLAGLCLLAALWQAGHESYGSFILPAPLETFGATLALLQDETARGLLVVTGLRAAAGFAMAAILGAFAGVVAGYFPAVLWLSRPILTVVIGVPPIAWIVLAMIWFGASLMTVALTIVISATPVVFMGAVEGVVTRDRGLDTMAEAFGAGPARRFSHIASRQIAAHLLPALVLALGSAFKVAVMAELLANAGGIGGALGRSRAMLDVSGAMAWVLLAVLALIAVEYAVLRPIQAELERWRDAAQPWGVKR